LRDDLGPERFGEGFRPLFWVRKGIAEGVGDPRAVRAPNADYAIVLHRKLVGLSELIAHIQVFPEQNVTLESVVLQLLIAAERPHPGLSKEELSGNIL